MEFSPLAPYRTGGSNLTYKSQQVLGGLVTCEIWRMGTRNFRRLQAPRCRPAHRPQPPPQTAQRVVLAAISER
jgi:hypothetical protein